jgi:hypothetical protein
LVFANRKSSAIALRAIREASSRRAKPIRPRIQTARLAWHGIRQGVGKLLVIAPGGDYLLVLTVLRAELGLISSLVQQLRKDAILGANCARQDGGKAEIQAKNRSVDAGRYIHVDPIQERSATRTD